jgi:hypothetical protein
MTDVRDILRRALPDAAPVPITRESAVAAGRRAVRIHRTRVGVAAMGIATAAVLAGSTLLGGTWAASTAAASPDATGPDATGPDATVSAPPPATPTSSPTAEPTAKPARPPVQRRLTEPASQATARLTAALKAAVHPLLPPSTLGAITIPSTNGSHTYRPLEVSRFEGGVYMGFAQVRDARGLGSLDFHLNPYLGDNPERRFARYCATVPPPAISCQTRIGPGGELIIVEIGHPSPSSSVVEYRVEMVKADGTALVSIARNVGDTIGLEQGPADRSDPPLSADQLVAILLSPGLTLYP